MSSFDKIVKLACKPKAAPPKAKYIDPIIAATWSDDGAVSDVCKALAPRIREPNHIVVFKALLVLHTMIRNGATDNVLSYLSQADTLRLKNVSAVNWEGYSAPENMQRYALYLDSRIKAYRELKHDAIRVQSDTNRDMRNSMSIDEEMLKHKPRNNDGPSSLARSKTLAGRKLRSMTVEKGLLRETKIVQRMIDALVECRFYLEDLDELNIEALRMLVKDLLILFQAGNEGVINVLEHYFEMSHIDAQDALKIYRNFCSQTSKVVEYLEVAKKMQNLLNVPIPNLKHAPVSLAGALQEYLDDPNFEQNRLEYRANKKASDEASKRPKDGKSKTTSVTFKESTEPSSSSVSGPSKANGESSKAKQDVIDLFASIEEEQQPMFAASPQAPVFPPQIQAPGNPFAQMMNGQQFGQVPQITAQPTGFLVPQHTVTPANPFSSFLTPQQPQQTGVPARPFSTFIPQQQTGFLQQPQQTGFMQPQQTGFLQPQATGSNPFRQSMLLPQTTGMQLFGNVQQPTGAPNSAGSFGQSLFVNVPPAAPNSAPNTAAPFSTNTNAFGQTSASTSAIAPTATNSAFKSSTTNAAVDVPNRPASTPLTSMTNSSFPTAQPVKTHQTGTKNPFGPVITTPPPVPKVPTLMDLAMDKQASQMNGMTNGQQQPADTQQQQLVQPQQPKPTGGFNWSNSALNPGSANISSIASSFTKVGQNNASPSADFSGQKNTSPTTSAFSAGPGLTGSLTAQPTGAPSSPSPLTSQVTGFAGLKPFKPSSSFGAALMESLPPVSNPTGVSSQMTGATNVSSVSGSSATTATTSTSGFTASSFTSMSSNPSAFSPSSTTPQPSSTPSFGALNSQPTGGLNAFKPTSAFGASLMSGNTGGSTLGVGLRPQMTGGGSANPFRASMAAGNDLSAFGSSPVPPVPGLPSNLTTGGPFGHMQNQQQQQAGGSTPFSSFMANQGQQQQQPQQSLI
ncbi:ENTH domain-containing protein [Coprinopsis cinerea okayama7|uniref:ENTH domain-containing protein n=1 Tax=Coprinopsis cinerea (strain Okayama-7 / 130 / ATCC MYA-4618 / FGSC 9003) TaxID=240176 RepID=A8N9G9_COPC7|nr:ENTH domain-containing protein [Coprinopsis cinerea okayama7\|eukprot:XP_001831475.2 ENTH domain-containing protein [Coprinopsis cinerea okayama7\